MVEEDDWQAAEGGWIESRCRSTTFYDSAHGIPERYKRLDLFSSRDSIDNLHVPPALCRDALNPAKLFVRACLCG
jgi:hypothetical protein